MGIDMTEEAKNKVFRYSVIALAGLGLLLNVLNYFSKRESFVEYSDVNQDGINDITSYNAKNDNCQYFIGRGNGLYEKAELKIDNGFPFFVTLNRWYDFLGNYFGFDGTIKRSDGLVIKLKGKK